MANSKPSPPVGWGHNFLLFPDLLVLVFLLSVEVLHFVESLVDVANLHFA
jgi:hypothetical protein